MSTMRSEWIGVRELAEELGVPVRTVYAWRHEGKGPRSALFGRHVRYRRQDIDEWIEGRMDGARKA